MLDKSIWWTPRPHGGHIAIASNAHRVTTSPAKDKFHENIVPHGRKNWNGWVYNTGRFNAIALPPQSYYQGPLTRGPFKCQPPLASGTPLGVCVDSRGPCHVSSPPVCHLRLTRPCHVALRAALHPLWSHAPRQPCAPLQPRSPANINPLFCILKLIKNQIKI